MQRRGWAQGDPEGPGAVGCPGQPDGEKILVRGKPCGRGSRAPSLRSLALRGRLFRTRAPPGPVLGPAGGAHWVWELLYF